MPANKNYPLSKSTASQQVTNESICSTHSHKHQWNHGNSSPLKLEYNLLAKNMFRKKCQTEIGPKWLQKEQSASNSTTPKQRRHKNGIKHRIYLCLMIPHWENSPDTNHNLLKIHHCEIRSCINFKVRISALRSKYGWQRPIVPTFNLCYSIDPALHILNLCLIF